MTPTTDLCSTYLRGFQEALHEFAALLEEPGQPPSLAALDEARGSIQDQLQRIAAETQSAGASATTAVYTLGIAGYYVDVAQALPGFAAALEAIDLAAWRVSRF